MYNWNVDKPAFDRNMHATLKKGKDGTNILTNWHILDQHLKKNKIKPNPGIDALAAQVILESWLREKSKNV